MIGLKDVTFSYPSAERAALSGITFSVSRGEVIGIIGQTGSGKSTLVQLISGLLSATDGSVTVCGQTLSGSKAPAALIRGKVGMVFQYPEHQLFEETVFRDIAFAAKNLGLSASGTEERVKEAMHLDGVPETLVDHSPFELSGGQKRRVAIAGVLAMHPDILILDEPAAGLDPVGRKKIFDSIRLYRETYGTTVLFVSHSMEDVARYADRVLVLKRGDMVLDGSVRDIFSHPEILRQCVLDIPSVSRIMNELADRGMPVDRGVLSVPEAVSELTFVFRGRVS